jgi:hypothetical protein
MAWKLPYVKLDKAEITKQILKSPKLDEMLLKLAKEHEIPGAELRPHPTRDGAGIPRDKEKRIKVLLASDNKYYRQLGHILENYQSKN